MSGGHPSRLHGADSKTSPELNWNGLMRSFARRAWLAIYGPCAAAVFDFSFQVGLIYDSS